MAYNALPPRPRGESRYIATVILNGLIKCILNNTKLGGKKGRGRVKCIYSVRWGEDVASPLGLGGGGPPPSCFPKRCGSPVGSGGRWALQLSGRNLRRETTQKGWGKMLAIKGLECQEKEGWTRSSVLRSHVVPSLETCPQKRGVFLISHF